MSPNMMNDPDMTTPEQQQQQESLQNDFAALLEKSFKTEIKQGVVLPGEILQVQKDGLLVDIGGKSEGFAPIREIFPRFSEDNIFDVFKAGQVYEFFILGVQEDDTYNLSYRRVQDVKSWDVLAEVRENQTTIEATVAGITKGGVLATVCGIKGFIPASQLRVTKSIDELSNDVLPVKVFEVDRQRNKLILSHRAAVFEMQASTRNETLARLQEGDVVQGEVVKITTFGVFVDINGIDGLLPLSEISWRRIKHPSDVLNLGDFLEVVVLNTDREKQRISLSLKRMQADPWETIHDHIAVGDVLEAKISKHLVSGVLAEIMPGVEAFCGYGNNGVTYQVDERYPFEVVSIAVPDRRITLSYRPDMVGAKPESEVAAEAAVEMPAAEVIAPEAAPEMVATEEAATV